MQSNFFTKKYFCFYFLFFVFLDFHEKNISADIPLEDFKNLSEISQKFQSKIDSLNKKLDLQLQSSLSISFQNVNNTPNKTAASDNFQRKNNFFSGYKTIKKQQNFGNQNTHSHSPLKETIITYPSFVSPEIKNKIIENEKKLYITNNICQDIFQDLDSKARTPNFVASQNFVSNSQKFENSPPPLSKMISKENNEDLKRKIDKIKEILQIDLTEKIQKFYELAIETQKKSERKKNAPPSKADQQPLINIIQAPTIPIEDFLDETEITIKNIKQDVNEELQELYQSVINKIK